MKITYTTCPVDDNADANVGDYCDPEHDLDIEAFLEEEEVDE